MTPLARLVPALALGLLLPTLAGAAELAEWSNPKLKIGIQYPAHWQIQLDPATLKALTEKGLESFDGVSEATDGQQFVLAVPAEPGVVPATMTLTTGKLGKQEARAGTQAIAESVYAQMPSMIPGAVQVAETRGVQLGGKEWYTADFQFVTQGIQFRYRQWIHVAKRGRTMYNIAIAGEAPAFDEAEAAFGPVLKSLELGW